MSPSTGMHSESRLIHLSFRDAFPCHLCRGDIFMLRHSHVSLPCHPLDRGGLSGRDCIALQKNHFSCRSSTGQPIGKIGSEREAVRKESKKKRMQRMFCPRTHSFTFYFTFSTGRSARGFHLALFRMVRLPHRVSQRHVGAGSRPTEGAKSHAAVAAVSPSLHRERSPA